VWEHLTKPTTWRHFLVGVAPGEPGQATAISVVEQVITLTRHNELETQRLDQSHLEQVPGGTSLADLAKRVDDIWAMLERQEESVARPALLVDISVLGRILPDLLAKRFPTSVMVTTGAEESVTDRGVNVVPRRELAAGLLHAVQTERFRTASALLLAPRLIQALQGFRYRPPANADDDLETMRRQADDDLVIAAALCVWQAARWVPTRYDLASTKVKTWDPAAEYLS
jgi:hypothetical protein